MWPLNALQKPLKKFSTSYKIMMEFSIQTFYGHIMALNAFKNCSWTFFYHISNIFSYLSIFWYHNLIFVIWRNSNAIKHIMMECKYNVIRNDSLAIFACFPVKIWHKAPYFCKCENWLIYWPKNVPSFGYNAIA